jgi:type III secretion system YscD/HrpQ family protein
MTKWIIKFLTGIHQGAEIPLKAGNYLIGCGETDDLILTDVALLENHFTLHLSETSVEISLPKDREPIYIDNDLTQVINDEADSNTRYSVTFPQIITVGTLKIVIGLESEKWQQVSLPELLIKREMEELNNKELSIIRANKDKKIKNLSIKKAIYTGVFVSLSLASIIFFNEDQNEIKTYIPQTQKWTMVKDKLRSDNLTFSENDNGAKITGRLKTKSDLEHLKTVMELANIQAKTDIIVDEILQKKLIKAISEIESEEINVGLGDNPGEFTLQGVTNKFEEIKEIILIVKNNTPEILKIINNTKPDNQVMPPRNIRMGLNVRSVNIGRTPYFITDDGQKFVSGSTLLNGLIIDNINTNFIQLKKGEEVFLHQLGAN